MVFFSCTFCINLLHIVGSWSSIKHNRAAKNDILRPKLSARAPLCLSFPLAPSCLRQQKSSLAPGGRLAQLCGWIGGRGGEAGLLQALEKKRGGRELSCVLASLAPPHKYCWQERALPVCKHGYFSEHRRPVGVVPPKRLQTYGELREKGRYIQQKPCCCPPEKSRLYVL